MTVGERSTVRREIRVRARPETIFPLLTDASKIVRWQGASAELEARPGGVFQIRYNSRDVARGAFVEVVPYQRLVFTWGWEGSDALPPGSSTVEITLTPDGEVTVVTLEHRDLPEAARDKHAEGWALYLNRLGIVAAGGLPGPDPNADAGTM